VGNAHGVAAEKFCDPDRVAPQSSKGDLIMAQTLVSLLVHIVFSTKNRVDLITPDIESRLHEYMAGTLRNMNSPCLRIGGTANHVHLLVSQSKNIAQSYLMEELKKSSSKWIKTKGRAFRSFAWQDGYGAFTIGQSNVATLMRYIETQKRHHQKKSFEDELRDLLARYQVEYDERYLLEVRCDPFRVVKLGCTATGGDARLCPRLLP
jgi:putative transposase